MPINCGLTQRSNNTWRCFYEKICAVAVEDDVRFELGDISAIREGDDYPGIRVCLKANYRPISVPLTVDVTTGDIITPQEIEYTFSLLFDDRTISVLAYNLETILAEKIETVMSRSVTNTRPRDFYDIHILYTLHGNEYDPKVLMQALEQTTEKRGSRGIIEHYRKILEEIQRSGQLQGFWQKYQKSFEYAQGISFDDACNSIWAIMESIIPLSSVITI